MGGVFQDPANEGMFLSAVGSLTALTELELAGGYLILSHFSCISRSNYLRPVGMTTGMFFGRHASQWLAMPTHNAEAGAFDPCTCMCKIRPSRLKAV